jgi:hypothetical protein
MKMINFKPILSGICLAAAVALPLGAMATPIVYDITSDHATGTGGLGTPPFGTVTLNQNGTSVDFTVHLYSPYYFCLTGAADFQDFKFNAVGVVVGDISITQNAPYTLVASAGAYNGDGTGNFGFGITGLLQGNGAAGAFNSDIMFSVANATIADLTVANNLGNIFVADLFSSNLNGLQGTGNTGPADVSTPPRVPDGGTTAFLLGAVVSALGLVRRKLSRA